MPEKMPRIPVELVSLLEPLKAVFADVAKRSVEAAWDTVLEEAESRVEGAANRISKARRGLGKPAAPRKDDREVVVDASASASAERTKKRRGTKKKLRVGR